MTVLAPFPADTDLLRDVVEASVGAAQDYLAMSGDGSVWQVPELWIQSEVARKIRKKHNIFIWMEPAMDNVIEWAHNS